MIELLHISDWHLGVEKLQGDLWETAYTDKDSCPCFRWKRGGVGGSEVTIEWPIPNGQPAGDYHIRTTATGSIFGRGRSRDSRV